LYYGDYEIGIVETRIHTFSEDYFKEVMVHELAHFTTYKYCDDYESHGATFLREQYRLDLMVFDKEKTQKILEKDIYRYTFQIPDANLEHIEFYANEHNYTTLNQFTVIEKIKAVQELITVSEKSLSYVANKNANQP
jgi:predicted SprT family Zn-dependent metalloprotease